MSSIRRLHSALEAVCPIYGVSVGDPENRDTWRIDFAPNATQDQIDAAEAVLAIFDSSTPNREDIDVERDRRIAAGVQVTIGGTTFTVQTRDERDFRNINGLASKGIVMTMTGDAGTVAFRDAGNVARTLNAAGLISMADQVAARVSAIYAASWIIKSASPLPADYADDARWP